MQLVWNSWEIHGKNSLPRFHSHQPRGNASIVLWRSTLGSDLIEGMNAKEDGFGFKLQSTKNLQLFSKHLWIWNEMILVPYNCWSVLRQGRTWLYYIDMCVVFLWMVFDFWVEVSRYYRLQDWRLKYIVPVSHTTIAIFFQNDSLSFICLCRILIQACMNLN